MIVGVTVLIVTILHNRLLVWIDQVVTSSILLNIQIMSEGAALNMQDIMQLNLNDLQIAKAYIEDRLTNQVQLNEGYAMGSDYKSKFVVQAWDANPVESYGWDKVTFFVDPEFTSTHDFDIAQSLDYQSCMYDSYFLTNLLSFEYGAINKRANWVAYNSGGICEWPAQYHPYFDSEYNSSTEEGNRGCGEEESRTWSVFCQEFFQKQRRVKTKPTVTQLSVNGNSAQVANSLEFILCDSLLRQNTQEFYAVLCSKQDTETFAWQEGTEFNSYEKDFFAKPIVTQKFPDVHSQAFADEIKARIE